VSIWDLWWYNGVLGSGVSLLWSRLNFLGLFSISLYREGSRAYGFRRAPVLRGWGIVLDIHRYSFTFRPRWMWVGISPAPTPKPDPRTPQEKLADLGFVE
jgi:hypothetical protein